MENDDKLNKLKNKIINTINKLTIELASEDKDKGKQMYIIGCLNTLDSTVDEIEVLQSNSKEE